MYDYKTNYRINGTRNGTSNVNTNPLKTEKAAYSTPIDLVIIGSVVSIEVAPPAEMGASFPKTRAKSGENTKVNISRMIFDNKAITPNVSPAISFISTLDKL